MGSPKCGKSALAECWINDNFIKKYEPTVAIDYQNKMIKLKSKYINVNLIFIKRQSFLV